MIELDAGMQSRTKERRVFLFEQIVIFSELLRKGSLTPGYMFKRSIKVRLPGGGAEARKNQVYGSCFPKSRLWVVRIQSLGDLSAQPSALEVIANFKF